MMRKLFLVALIILILVLGIIFRVDRYLNLAFLKANIDNIREIAKQSPLIFASAFFLLYLLAASFSFPGALILTIAAGAIFGIFYGTILVSFASSIGATCAFLLSRYILSNYIRSKFGNAMASVDRGIAKEGSFYLFALRLAPIFPFFLVNLLMGLTKMRAITFYGISQVGMLPGTLVYVNAGLQLSKIDSLSRILSFEVWSSLLVLGILPLVAHLFLQLIRKSMVKRK